MKLLNRLLGLIAVLAIGWLFFEIAREVLRLYGTADPDIKLGVMTAIGSLAAFLVTNGIQSERERRARLFESKREAYGVFFKSYMAFFHKTALGEELDPDEMVRSIQSLSRDVMTWGSADTVNAFNKFQRENSSPTDDTVELFRRNEDFLRALRKDLGHKDTSLNRFALTKLILKADEHEKLD